MLAFIHPSLSGSVAQWLSGSVAQWLSGSPRETPLKS